MSFKLPINFIIQTDNKETDSIMYKYTFVFPLLHVPIDVTEKIDRGIYCAFRSSPPFLVPTF